MTTRPQGRSRTLTWTAGFLLALLPAGICQDEGGGESGEKQDEDAAMKALEDRHAAERHRLLRRRFAVYADELERLQAELRAKGRAADADAVAAERRRVMEVLEAKEEPLPASGMPMGPTPQERAEAFAAGLTPEPSVEPVAGAGASSGSVLRVRQLKIEKAGVNRDLLEYGSSGVGRGYWSHEKATAAWTVSNLAPGEYAVVLRFLCGASGGGTVEVQAGRDKFTVEVPQGDSWSKRQVLQAGTVKVTGSGLDVRVVAKGKRDEDGSIWDLRAVMLEPVAGSAGK